MNRCLMPFVLACAGGVTQVHADEVADPKIKDFLADTGATYVGAAGIINLDDKLISNVATPKDFVVAIGQGQANLSQAGFGIAFAPGRSVFDLVSVDIKQHAQSQSWFDRYTARRLWNSTTFSYAQNKREVAKVDYTQKAYAGHVEYFLDVKDDPAVAAYRWIVGPWDDAKSGDKLACKALQMARKPQAGPAVLSRARTRAQRAAPDDDKTPPNLVAEYREAKALADGMRPLVVLARARGDANADKAAGVQKGAEDLQQLIKDCAAEALEKSRAKWNASKFTLLVGKGTIRGPNAADPRLSLGTHVQLGYQMAPPHSKDSLFKVTLHRASGALNLDSLGKTPTYQSRTLAAARYTYGHGEDRQMYFLGEISNASAKNAGVASGAFKYAVGLDKKLADSLWLELRVGRSMVRNADKDETKAIANLKFSFDSELAALK